MLPPLPVLPEDATDSDQALWLYLSRIKEAVDGGLPGLMTDAMELGGLGYSPLSPLAEITLPLAPGPPDTPTGLTATPFYRQIGLSWDLDTNLTITGWQVQRASNAGFTSNVSMRTSARALSFLDTGLADSTTYYYQIGRAHV